MPGSFILPPACLRMDVEPITNTSFHSNKSSIQWIIIGDVSVDIERSFRRCDKLFDVFSFLLNTSDEKTEMLMFVRFSAQVRYSALKNLLVRTDINSKSIPQYVFYNAVIEHQVWKYMFEFSKKNKIDLIRSFFDENNIFNSTKMEFNESGTSFESLEELITKYERTKKKLNKSSHFSALSSSNDVLDINTKNPTEDPLLLSLLPEMKILDDLLNKGLSLRKIRKMHPVLAFKHASYLMLVRLEKEDDDDDDEMSEITKK